MPESFYPKVFRESGNNFLIWLRIERKGEVLIDPQKDGLRE